MIYKGLFYITSLSNTKYIWQYEINKQNSDYQIYNVIRPCVLIKNNKRFWDFNTPTVNNLKLNNNDMAIEKGINFLIIIIISPD